MSPRRLVPLVVLFGLVSVLAPAQAAASRPTMKGTLTTEKGVRVLRLHGSHEEMGFAHGYLLAAEIVEGLESYIINSPVVLGAKSYTEVVLPKVKRLIAFSPEHEAELRGMLAGIREGLGGKAPVPLLGRELELIDLQALNSYGDWYRFACSSFSVWGKLSADGKVITARNFDFPPKPILEKTQLLIGYAPADLAEKRWVNVAFPGIIGLISGMSEDGVGLFVHDVAPKKGAESAGVHSRLLALRDAIEAAPAADAVVTVHKLLRDRTTWMGNNVHVTSPWDGTLRPAGIIEYDGLESLDEGATLRLSDDADEYVLCTNHYRLRATPQKCSRYSRLSKQLAELAEKGKKVDPTVARSLMSSITQDSLFSRTVHTVIFQPSDKRLSVMMTHGGKVAPASEPVTFTLDELLPPRR